MNRWRRLRVRVGLWVAGVPAYENREGDAVLLRAPRRLSRDEVEEIRQRWEAQFTGPQEGGFKNGD